MSSQSEIFSPVFREISYRSPDLVYEKLMGKNSFLLESVGGPSGIARYSFICIDPYIAFKVKDGIVEIESDGKRTISSRNPLQRLKELIHCYVLRGLDNLPPFQGGAVGMFSYDFARYIEKLPCAAVDDLGLPDAHFFMVDRVVAFDHLEERCWIIVCPGVRKAALGFSAIEGATAGHV